MPDPKRPTKRKYGRGRKVFGLVKIKSIVRPGWRSIIKLDNLYLLTFYVHVLSNFRPRGLILPEFMVIMPNKSYFEYFSFFPPKRLSTFFFILSYRCRETQAWKPMCHHCFITIIHTYIHTSDVNFVFFQKSIFVLKNRFFFDYRICASLTVQRHY